MNIQNVKKIYWLCLGWLFASTGFMGLAASSSSKSIDHEIEETKKQEQVIKFEENKSSEPYYSWLGTMISKARNGYEKFIVTNPSGSALIVSLVEGSLVGFYLYKLKPGEKVSSKKAIIASLVTALSCFSLRKNENQARANKVGITDIKPVLKKDAASLPLELAVRGADLLWQLLSEILFLSRQVKTLDGIVTDEWGSTLQNYFGINQTRNYVNSNKKGLIVTAAKDAISYSVVPFIIHTATLSTSLVTHELGHGIAHRLITGELFSIVLGVPFAKYNFTKHEFEDAPLYSKNILGVPVKIYSLNTLSSAFCVTNKLASSKSGVVAFYGSGPLGGIVGATALCGARSLITKKSLVSQCDNAIQDCFAMNLENLLNPYLKVSPQVPSDGARIYNALGINP